MKKYLTFIVLLSCAMASAQNIGDVLRYSQENLQGTARFQGMGGAFGALGGDLSALNINPAGSAVFRNSQFTVSGSSYNTDNSSTYFGTSINANNNNLDINQVGGVFVFKSNNGSDWKRIAIALNYDLVQSFDDEFSVSGTSDQGIDNYFLDYAGGVPYGSILLQDGEYIEDGYLNIGETQGFQDQQAFLGYYGGIIDPVDQNNDTSTYISNASYNTVNQDYSRFTSGYNGKFNVNLGTQYKNNLYLGASLNFHTVSYEQLDELREGGYNSDSPIKTSRFSNFLHTEGSGFSFNLGAIAKLNQNIRVGGSYQSPTWYRLTDDFSQQINSNLADDNINFINHNVVNVFEAYTIKTPSKLTGSMALVFGKDGLLSFDYSYQDMSQAELRPVSDSAFSGVNSTIANNLGKVSSIRVGGEYRIDQVSLRAGYRLEQSPYANGNNIGDLNGYSGGIGYNFGRSRLDLAANRIEQDYNMQLFDAGLTTPALINKKNTNVTLSYTMNF